MRFFVGIHMVAHAWRFPECMISVNRLITRKSTFTVNDWILDSGAFTELSRFGGYRSSVTVYAEAINRLSENGTLLAAVSQDYMCEPFILNKTGLTVLEHQNRTIERYDQLVPLTESYIMPVLQGYQPDEYIRHIELYGERLSYGQWVGVGSVCKRNASPLKIIEVLDGIQSVRPDLRLHGFGIKYSSLAIPEIHNSFTSTDSMAWSFAARMEGRGRDANKWDEAMRYRNRILGLVGYRSATNMTLRHATTAGGFGNLTTATGAGNVTDGHAERSGRVESERIKKVDV